MTTRTALIALCLLGAGFDGSSARAAGPDLDTFATGLLGPSKIIRTPRGAFLVAETGPEEPNNGRVSIVDPDGGRHTLLGRDRLLPIIDAGLNAIRTVDLVSGEEEMLATFPPTPSPLPFGPPVIENVPTSIRWAGRDLLVTLLSGAPAFLPGYSQVQRVDPRTGAVAPLIAGLSSAIDVLPLPDNSSERVLTLEFNLTFPVPGPGRLQLFGSDGESAVLSDRLTTPSSMVLDGKGGRLVIAELAAGRLVTLELP